MMKSEIGYEHYFLNYFLHLPFSQIQEEKILKESLKLMIELGICKFSNGEELKSFLEDINCLFEDLKQYCEMEGKFIKKKLKLANMRRIDVIKEELMEDKSIRIFFPNSLGNLHSISGEDKFFDENDKNLSKIIYGDYKYNNENVEVYLHQRTMKKVRYKKRSYSMIHPINNVLIEKIINESDHLLNEMNSLNSNRTNDSLVKEMKLLREKY